MTQAGRVTRKDLRLTRADWRDWRLSLLVLGVLVAWGLLKGGRRASGSFFELAAQIIPVLIVALAVERNVRRGWARWVPVRRVQVLGALLLGELAALAGAALGKEEPAETLTDAQLRQMPTRDLLASALKNEQSSDYLVYSSRWLTDVLSWITVLGLLVGFVAVIWITLLRSAWTQWISARRGRS